MRSTRLLPLALACITGTAPAQSLTFEQYYPHTVEQTLVFNYVSTAEGATTDTYRGKLTRKSSGTQTVGEITYQTVTHTTRGLPDFFPTQWKTYHRVTDDGLITGSVNESGDLEEYLEFPARAEAGEPWPEPSNFWETEKSSVVPYFETPAGNFEDCIRVERVRQDRASGQTLRNTTTYCPGLSAVHSTIEHMFQEYGSLTELTLISIKP